MYTNIKIVIIAAASALVVSLLSFAGFVVFWESQGLNLKNWGASGFLPERIIVKEQPQIIEKYIPQTTQEQMIVGIVKQAQDAVVSVIANKDLPVYDQYMGDFWGFQIPQLRQRGTEKKEVSSGTGFVVSTDGLILTNKHVVSDDSAEFTVLTNGGDKYPAKVLAVDPMQDIAVLKIDKKGLPMLKLGDSDNIEIGQSVIAIGNALGEFRNTVSIGVVSGLRRTITAAGGGMSETLEDLIQTDAAINPGNSGGPLLNLNGEVIGINTAMTQAAQNIGFALPINKVKRDLDQVKKTGKITYPFLGVRYTVIDSELAKEKNLPVDYGALVIRGETTTDFAVTPGSPADKAGIIENDIILEINGKRITTSNPLAKIVQSANVGDTLTLKILHKGDEKIVKPVLTERK